MFNGKVLKIDDGLLLFYGGLLLMVHAKSNRAEMLDSNTPCSEDLIAVLNSNSSSNTPTAAKT